MPNITVRGISDRTMEALQARAKQNGSTVEAEIKAILTEAYLPKKRTKIGTEIRKLVEQHGGVDLNIERDKTPARFVDFSGPEFHPPEHD
jgi:antitoxin FitA